MKKALYVVALALLVHSAVWLIKPVPVQAQTQYPPMSYVNSATLTGCNFTTVANNLTSWCTVVSGTTTTIYASSNGGAPVIIYPQTAAAAGVTSFNNRTGAITLTKTDVLGTNIAATVTINAPTTTSTTTAPTGTVTLQ